MVFIWMMLFFWGYAVCTASQPDLIQKKARVDELFSQWAKPGSPGAAVVIVQKGEIIYKKNYGMADLEHNIPITDTTVFCIGSVSKQFTGFIIAQLEEEGKLSLDDDIRKYLPGLPDFGDTVTIRHLIHHTSGLREQFHLFTMAGVSLADTITMEQIFKLVKRQKKLNFKPGDRVMYSNTGYSLLAMIIERVTGKSFRQYAHQVIFKPLGMNDAFFHDNFQEVIKNRARSYAAGDDGVLINALLNHGLVGNTGLFTTANDLAKWIKNFMNPKIGGDNFIKKMTGTFTLNDGEKSDYGFGIGVTQYRGLNVLLHSGHDSAYRCYLSYFPDQVFGLAVLTNFYSINPSSMGKKIEDIFLAEHFPSKKEKKGAAEQTSSDIRPTVPLTDQQAVEFTGTYYSGELDTTYYIILRDGKLFLTHSRNEDVSLTFTGKDTFSTSAWWLESISFKRGPNGKISGCNFSSGRARDVYFLNNPLVVL